MTQCLLTYTLAVEVDTSDPSRITDHAHRYTLLFSQFLRERA